jgi:hypothetical protein
MLLERVSCMAFLRQKLKYGLGQEQAMQARLMGRGHPVCDFPSCKIKTFHGHDIKGNKTFSTLDEIVFNYNYNFNVEIEISLDKTVNNHPECQEILDPNHFFAWVVSLCDRLHIFR